MPEKKESPQQMIRRVMRVAQLLTEAKAKAENQIEQNPNTDKIPQIAENE